jgi:4-carboxymuconolactone decarboxylase
MKKTLAALAMTTLAGTALAVERFPVLTKDQLNPEQAKFVAALLAGPRGGDDRDSPAAVQRIMEGGPFNAWARSPDLGDRLQKVGEYIRYGTSIPFRLNEFAILITARHWTSQYEWFAHLPLALKAGLDPKIAEQLRLNKRPQGMKPDEAMVYEFCTELHRKKNVSDATYAKAVEMFGEKGVMDLIGVSGYYTAVSMTLNVADVPLPKGEPLPLPPIK